MTQIFSLSFRLKEHNPYIFEQLFHIGVTMSHQINFTNLNNEQFKKVKDIITELKEKDDINNKRECLMFLIEYYLGEDTREYPDIEVLKPDEIGLEKICELNFLKKIEDIKDHILKWFCLKHQRPDGKGKPVLMGNNVETIKILCQACKDGFIYNQQKNLTEEQTLAIIKFGESEIITMLYSCIHPENDFIQINLGGKGTLFCKLSMTRKDIIKTCDIQVCDYLFKNEIKIKVAETEPYKELKKALPEVN